MSQSLTNLTTVDCQTVSETTYDVVIVGAGVAGAIVAKELSQQGKRVLILEAGKDKDFTLAGFQSYLETFYAAAEKNPNAPYPDWTLDKRKFTSRVDSAKQESVSYH